MSPFLNIGIILAIFKESGKIPVVITLFTIKVMELHISFLISLRGHTGVIISLRGCRLFKVEKQF